MKLSALNKGLVQMIVRFWSRGIFDIHVVKYMGSIILWIHYTKWLQEVWSISTRAIQCEIGFGRLIEEVGGGKCTTSKGQRYLNGISDEICPSFPYRRLIRYRLYALYFLEVRPWKNTFLSKQMEFLHLAYIKSWLIFFSFFLFRNDTALQNPRAWPKISFLWKLCKYLSRVVASNESRM